MYVADTTLIVYQAWAGEGGVGGLTLLSKQTGPEGPDKVGSAGEPGFTRICARPGTVHTASMVPAGGSGSSPLYLIT